MMRWWDKNAAALQERVRFDETKQIFSEYDDGDARKATVHAREDIVLIVSHLSSVNRQLASIKCTAFFILCVLIYIAFELSR